MAKVFFFVGGEGVGVGERGGLSEEEGEGGVGCIYVYILLSSFYVIEFFFFSFFWIVSFFYV